MKKRIWFFIVIILIASMSYFKGYKDGEQSIYEKAKNDAELLELYK